MCDKKNLRTIFVQAGQQPQTAAPWGLNSVPGGHGSGIISQLNFWVEQKFASQTIEFTLSVWRKQNVITRMGMERFFILIEFLLNKAPIFTQRFILQITQLINDSLLTCWFYIWNKIMQVYFSFKISQLWLWWSSQKTMVTNNCIIDALIKPIINYTN